eukprot:TRINITY_DN3752_c0_g2_i3.p1 TRINITY_DN3752_c0_g2~~TRINITY_DN3752_c0_g2_i3.p1  ORF type:complete len:253 (+),score=27.99 TRINITY_DN3752_c0_g2_i3:176-934(+)
MGTEILFWEDTYLFGCESKVVDLNVQEGAIIVTLDRTICYAASGGQPSDEGKIEVEKEIEHENVDKTLMIKELHWSGNNILHSCEVRDPIIAKILAVGDKVKVSINPEKRILHARLHSAGHLIDAALENIGIQLRSSKAYHYPNGAYVEYMGKIEQNIREDVLRRLEKECNRLIEIGGPIFKEVASGDRVTELCRGEFPSFLPKDKPVRLICVANLWIPCGGKNLRDVREILNVKITKIRSNKEKIKISYSV